MAVALIVASGGAEAAVVWPAVHWALPPYA